MSATFVEQCLAGDVDADAIDDFVDEWHERESGAPIWEFLGMTRDEYGLWVERPAALPAILYAHRFGTSLESALDALSVGALGGSKDEVREVKEWLARRSG